MGLVTRLNMASTLNIAAICASLALISAIVAGVF
jgi:hypothetical protein